MNDREKLFSDFPPVSAAEWEAKIKEDLDGADYARKLVYNSPDNITIKPYYTSGDLSALKYLDQDPGSFPYVRGNKTENNSWEIRQDIEVRDFDAALEKMHLAELRGVTSIGLDLTTTEIHYQDFLRLVGGIDLSKTELNLITSGSAPRIFDFLVKALDELAIDTNLLRGSLGFDPLGNLAETGGFIRSQQDDFTDAAKFIAAAHSVLPSFRVLSVNSNLFGNSGGSAVQELAFGLSMMSDYLSNLTGKDLSPEIIVKNLQWNLSIGSEYFIEIAKVRAARMLFSALISAFGQPVDSSVFIHSITTKWNKTLYDPNVNLLRLTTEAMSAILGGCNSLLVQPFDSSYNEPTDFSERLARNVQIILKEESYFDKVVDPAAGSYFIESITDSLIKNSWELFLKIDDQGGFIKTFTEGFISREIADSAKRRYDRIATRREVLVGTNQYPNSNESITGCISEDIAFSKASENPDRIAGPVINQRAAADFEKLRLSTEKHPGPRPRVFLLTYGNLAMRLARSQFSANFFACAGYEVIENLGCKTIQEGVDKALQAKSDIIVLCSSDDEYATIAPEAAGLVNHRAILVVAGAPPGMEELRQKGITEFISIRSNVLETLKAFHNKLGIEIK